MKNQCIQPLSMMTISHTLHVVPVTFTTSSLQWCNTMCLRDLWVGNANPNTQSLMHWSHNRALLTKKDSALASPLLSWSHTMSRQTCVHLSSPQFYPQCSNHSPPSTLQALESTCRRCTPRSPSSTASSGP